jgi:CubicO group peptidase (beta-lactamase class C family)
MSPKTGNWPLPFVRPEEAGFSSQRLAQIRPGLQKYIDEQKVPNLVTLVARHGKVVHYDAQGYMDFESKKPVGKDTIFRLYSNSKPVTGVATMILYEEGRLTLDDPIAKYIPAFKNTVVRFTGRPEGNEPAPTITLVPTIPARRGITIRDCLRNTTGLATPQRVPMAFLTEYRDTMMALGWYPGSKPKPMNFRERVELQARLPLSFQPSTDFEYYVGYPVIGVVIEQIVGKTLEEFYQERIFKPLGMKDTSFYLPGAKLARFPACYRPERQGREWELVVAERPETSEKVTGPKIYFGAGGDMGGILSTAADYARFAQMLLNGGELDGVRILGRKTVELMTASHTGPIIIPMTGRGFGFGMGVGVHTGGSWRPIMRSIGAYGWGGAAGTTYFADPKEDLIAVCFTQVLMHTMMPGNTYQEAFERLVYQSLV